MTSLDVDAVRTFVMVADLRSFTRAAAALGSTQATISVKLRRLEEKLGARLIERTPRRVSLSARGAIFLPAAREFLAAHERAIAEFSEAPCRLALGFVDHVAGPELSILIAQLHAHDPSLALNIRIDTSSLLEDAFDRGELDAVIVHRESDGRRGEALSRTHYGWFATPAFEWRPGTPLRLALLSTVCNCPDRVRAVEALDKAGIAWNEAYVGGGGAAVNIAVSAGFALSALAYRVAPPGLIEVGRKFSLPPIPSSEIVLHARALAPRAREALKMLTTAFRESNLPTG
ncbi:LysR family transcriptional regulator [Mesorhizobium sp. M7A.F.Ca.US.008.03.1.1]|uniref:LysR family transcriptional regulator n=1 Tax=Mesorhizobium sp. M7A.F.Ca.US.008.03.1.1 TaxID=2496742 RepID=UPI000FC9D72A|nr:LysR family transcriptional regulator [Mesorhizobium sp. M7A.F.Ca.US.008.03.1.1]RUW59145.1 LysR family transcriptional regulator [Mesorhizobium sp. M7A.F.Ca.US.008.03.1.1]